MLDYTDCIDYEVNGYTVEYHRIGACTDSASHFDTEEEAVEFIKDCRHRWDRFTLIQYRVALIDF